MAVVGKLKTRTKALTLNSPSAFQLCLICSGAFESSHKEATKIPNTPNSITNSHNKDAKEARFDVCRSLWQTQH